jgi:hypothetical protein
MAETISRLYGKASDADAAAAKLRAHNFAEGEVIVVHPPASGGSVASLAATIAQGGVLKALAAIYAKGVAAGGSIVTVHAPFSAGYRATKILDAHNPIDSGAPSTPSTLMKWDDAAPLSSALQISTISRDAAPASNIFGMPLLTNGRASLSEAIGWPEVTNNPGWLSSKLGLQLLIDNPAWLSSNLGIPTLKS